ncbi:response regulator [Halovenus salina]|uniref:Response regulator n=1 Tax=Halovenus salina TaxID=1510225 RepID=A0ABD5VVU9_9EURY|nr:response regulator [Halovenus salina]
MSSSPEDTTVLVVDDENDVADAYALQLDLEYQTETAYGGEDALEQIDNDVDVVLLDRRMPDLSGDEVLEEIRDRGLDCAVVMVTAVDPDFDIVEMPFDDYICKPADRDTLTDAIEKQLSVSEYDNNVQEYMEVSSKLELLKSQKTAGELEASEEITELEERVEDLESTLDEVVKEFDDPAHAFRDLV